MRILRAGVALAAALVACSSDEEPSKPSCSIPGTYTMVGRIQQQSEGCAPLGTSAPQTTVTVTAANGGGYVLEFAGLTGSCLATTTETCSIQAKCDTSAPGTLQLSWKFLEEGGFSGTNVGVIRASSTFPDGCNYTAAAAGSRL